MFEQTKKRTLSISRMILKFHMPESGNFMILLIASLIVYFGNIYYNLFYFKRLKDLDNGAVLDYLIFSEIFN